MKLQFGLYELLCAMAFIGVGLGGMLAGLSHVNRLVGNGETIGIVASPIWVPIVFLGFAVGRRSIGLKTVVAMAIAEAAILTALNLWLPPY